MRIAGTPIRTFEGYFLASMLVVDLVFLAMSLTHHYGAILADRRYSINGHGGFGEMWQYLKELCCFAMLVNAATRCRQPLLMAWAILFLYLFLTDVFRINHLIAGWLTDAALLASISPEFSKWHYKLVVVALAGSVLLPLLALCHWRTSQSMLRDDSTMLALLFLVYLLFGVAVDLFNRGLKQADVTFYDLAVVIEEWGEMLVMSLLVVGTYLTFVRALRNNLFNSNSNGRSSDAVSNSL